MNAMFNAVEGSKLLVLVFSEDANRSWKLFVDGVFGAEFYFSSFFFNKDLQYFE